MTMSVIAQRYENNVRLDTSGGRNHWHCSSCLCAKTWLRNSKMSYSVFTENDQGTFAWLIKEKLFSGLQALFLKDCILDAVITTCANCQSRSTPVSASHSVIESAGHILFNDNTLIPFNSIITVSKWPSTATVGARNFKALSIPDFTLRRKGLAIFPLSSQGTISWC